MIWFAAPQGFESLGAADGNEVVVGAEEDLTVRDRREMRCPLADGVAADDLRRSSRLDDDGVPFSLTKYTRPPPATGDAEKTPSTRSCHRRSPVAASTAVSTPTSFAM